MSDYIPRSGAGGFAERVNRTRELGCPPSPNGKPRVAEDEEFRPWNEERDGYVSGFFSLGEEEQDAMTLAMARSAAVVEEAPELPVGVRTKSYPAFNRWLRGDRPRFPSQVFPGFAERYITAAARSIHCCLDLLAVTLLAVAGAATGRSGRRLQVKEGWLVSSCLLSHFRK